MQQYIQTFKIIFFALLAAFIMWLYNSWQYQKSENIRQAENFAFKVKQDSLHYSEQILSKEQMNDYLKYEKSELYNKLKENGIKPNRVESITTNNYYYKDTIKKVTDVSKLVSLIKNDVAGEQPFEAKDSLECSTTKGKVVFDGKKLKVEVTSQEHKNNTESVAYWERKQWSFLGIKTRFLGKIQMTAKNFDNCGKSNVMRVEKKSKKN